MPWQIPARARAIQTLLLCIAALLSAMTVACARSDSDLQAELQKQLAADATTANLHVTATVTKGVARVSGETQTRAQQTRVLEIARAVKGVSKVESAMRLSDAALTEAVKKAIAEDSAVAGVPLRVEVHDGEVKLFSDQTNADQRTKLAEIAKAVDGVTHVEDDMR